MTSLNIEPGQRWYNERVEQHCIVLGKNYIGAWLLQYEDGDIVEWNHNGIGTPNGPGMVYRRAPRSIEKKRPTLTNACHPSMHKFFGGPFDFPLPRDNNIKCARCGLHVTAIEEDLNLGNKVLELLPFNCSRCDFTMKKGYEPTLTPEDKLLCNECASKTDY